MRSLRTILLVAVAVALTVALAACGSSSKSSSSSSSASAGSGSVPAGVKTPVTESLTGGKRGGVLNDLQSEDFEHLDPGQAYFQLDYQITNATQRSLYSYKPNTFSESTPDMAEGPAQLGDGNKLITINIRKGVHFSPPVNREVTAADEVYAFERIANPNVANPYYLGYLAAIEGMKTAKGGPIPGVKATGKYTLQIKLTEPEAPIVVASMVLPWSAPVPKEYAAKFDAKKPSEYANNQVATGPYMLKNDAAGKVLGIGYQPGKSATLVRNPNWSASTDYRPGYLNQINISIGGDANVIGRQVLEGSDLVQSDAPAAPIVKLAVQQHPSQLVISAGGGAGDRYVAVNNSNGPFKNVNLRKALWAATDREALDRLRGGKTVADVMTHFLWNGIAGFEESGGFPGPKVDYNEHPTGDMAVAEKYMKLAGYPSGKYTGSETLQVVGDSSAPANNVAETVNQTLRTLGFKTKLNLVEHTVMYAKYCGVVSEKIDVCPNVGWIADFGDPQAVLDVPFNGNLIVKNGTNSNWGLVNHPKINAAMEAAKKVVGTKARGEAWAKIDRELVEEAVAIPYQWAKEPYIEAKNVVGVNQYWNSGTWDYSFTSLK
ncbi:MAG: peptide/nickel transport system substrate-binding protein [Solirubrobacteraceae bacterium]|jgi:peptide/nickel transport system substrate-binding protein|nr:peptide/nickel transport system substrate-binding protein [Solirubrobacteraceae bacterium]